MPVPSVPIRGDFENLLDLFDEVLRVAPEVEAYVQPSASGVTSRMTFLEWATRADALAGWLDDRGVKKGDVVGIRLPSCIDYVVAYQAITRVGAIATGINPRYGQGEVDHIVNRSKPVHIFDGPLPEVTGGDPFRRRVTLSHDDPIAIVWTGGTTGYPKGAWFDHRCLEAMTGGAGDLSHVGDRRLSPLPFAHVGAMTRLWDELMHVITTIIVPSPWTAEGALAAINDERVTVSQGVPTQYRMMFDHPRFAETDVSHLRVAGIGAARIPPELVIEMREKLGCNVLARYTSTEACVSTGTSINDDIDTICNTVGKPSAAVELRLVHEDGHACEQSEVGVVQLRSRAMMRGYWKDEERTREAFSSDGFLITGDLGFVDPKGDLHLVGRNTEMFIRGGYNVYPVEIENLLGAHPDVAAAAVVGASVDDRLGEIGVLFAVPRPGTTLTLESVRDHVRASLASYKAPDVLVCVTELPLTSLGKVDKKQLQPLADKEAAAWQR